MEFVAAVSHELRTPLAVIRSAAANLADGVVSDGEQVRKYGALVASEGRRLTDLVERVMTFAGLSSGPPLTPVPVDVSCVVREASEMSAAEAHDRRVELVVQDADPGLIVAADRDALRSALENVIGNAIKYSVGGGQVKVDVVRNDGHVRITVADRGIGIDRDELTQIFQPFVRGRRAIDAQIRGAGIGLSVVKRVVDAHNGEVRAESDPGEGTRVTIELPLA
jgi:signal transduction histidine kinase